MELKAQNLAIKTQWVFWLGMLVVGVAAIILRAALLETFPLSPDEGIHLMWLRLLSAGYQPYTQVYITYPPLYPLAIEAVWKIWPTETALRWFSVFYTLFGAVGIALLARHWAGAVAGVAAAALTLFSPVLVEPSVGILAEFPSVAWSVWAIWLAWLAGDELANTPAGNAQPFKARMLLIMSGLCLSASLLTKLLSPFVALLIPLTLVIRWYQFPSSDSASRPTPYILRFSAKPPPGTLHTPHFTLHASHLKSLLTNLFIWGLAVLLPALILISAFNVESLVGQVVEQRLGARAAATESEPFWPPRYERGAMFLQEDTALVVLGLVGLGLAWVRRQPGRWLMVAWLLLALGMLAIHNPIRYKHYLILIPPLAIFGGVAIAQWIYDLQSTIYNLMNQSKSPLSNLKSQIIALVGLILLIGLYAWQIPAALSLWQAKAAVPQPPTDEVEALAFIEAVTAPHDCLISDDMPLLYWSGRMAPPELAEVSTNRLESGALTTAQLIVISDRYDCQLVAAVTNRITQYLPDYMAWVKSKYLGRFHYGEDDLYFAKIDTDPQPASPLSGDFDGQIMFHGYTLSSPPSSTGEKKVCPGDRIPLTLFWQAQTPLGTDYAIFVQLRDATNTTLASADHQPYQGLAPTSTWPAGSVIQEVTWLQLPPDIPAGSYNIYVGLYRPDNLERLPLRADASGENALILGPLVVQ